MHPSTRLTSSQTETSPFAQADGDNDELKQLIFQFTSMFTSTAEQDANLREKLDEPGHPESLEKLNF